MFQELCRVFSHRVYKSQVTFLFRMYVFLMYVSITNGASWVILMIISYNWVAQRNICYMYIYFLTMACGEAGQILSFLFCRWGNPDTVRLNDLPLKQQCQGLKLDLTPSASTSESHCLFQDTLYLQKITHN